MGRRSRTLLTDQPVRFITTTFNKWQAILIDESYFKILTDSLNFMSSKYQTDVLSYVFMPNHIHLVLFFSKPAQVSDYMRDFKKFTSGELRRKLLADNKTELLKELETSVGRYKIWMERFDDFVIRNAKSVHTKINYIHQNPVRKNLAASPAEYNYSSARFYESEEAGAVKVTHFLEAMGAANQYSYGQITY